MKFLLYRTLFLFALALSSCDKFLEKKQDIKMALPETIADVTHLLNDYSTLNANYPIWGEQGIDDYYVAKADWDSYLEDYRNAYVWADKPYADITQWQRPYRVVYYANQALEILDKVDKNEDLAAYKRNRGGAYFFRAFAFQLLAEVHCPAYQLSTAASELGIPLRLNAGVDEPSKRASLLDTYKQIVADFQLAAQFLPVNETAKGRPFKGAAYAGAARAHLSMGDYEQAYRYADSCLQVSPKLLDYNTLKVSDGYPIPRFNVEVLFPAGSAGMALMNTSTAIIDDALYQSYQNNDLRKIIYFEKKSGLTNAFSFKGSYEQNSSPLFMGITTSEVYLIKAEAAARLGRSSEAQSAINSLLQSRWSKDAVYTPITESNADALLRIILTERRKELVFRGRRWSDLKRLNLDPRFQKTLTRQLGADTYILAPNDPKYAFRLSETAVKQGGISQNKR